MIDHQTSQAGIGGSFSAATEAVKRDVHKILYATSIK